MARGGLVWQVPPTVIAVKITALGPALRVRIAKRLQSEAARLQDQMKARAPWTDRTGAARRSLAGRATVTASAGIITLSHGADYGIYLERSNQGRYAIVGPTLQTEGPRVIEALGGLL